MSNAAEYKKKKQELQCLPNVYKVYKCVLE